jgi:hypothetical protein
MFPGFTSKSGLALRVVSMRRCTQHGKGPLQHDGPKQGGCHAGLGWWGYPSTGTRARRVYAAVAPGAWSTLPTRGRVRRCLLWSVALHRVWHLGLVNRTAAEATC